MERSPRSGGWIASLGTAADAPRPLLFHVLLTNAERTLGLAYSPGSVLPSLSSRHADAAIFDGLLHNRDDLIDELLGRGESSPNDASLILHAYRRWGEEFLHRIKGVFSLVVWDAERDALVCARDALGAFPLYFASTPGSFLLSQSIDALVGHPHVSRAVNRLVLAEHLSHLWLDAEETCYESVRRIPPGHVLRRTGSVPRIRRWWDPAPLGTEVAWVRDHEIERFAELFERAVISYLRTGPAGIFLSGGLDSVSVAAVAVDAARQRGLTTPLALSLVFPDPSCNEEVMQKAVAQGLGMPQTFTTFDEALGLKGLLEAALEVGRGWPTPLLNFWLPAYHHLGFLGKQRGCRVILTGNGGDEWLTVSPFLAADLIRRGDLVGVYHLWRSQQRSVRISQVHFLKNVLWQFGVRPLVAGTAKRALLALSNDFSRRLRRHRFTSRLPHWLTRDVELRRQIVERFEGRIPWRTQDGFYLHEARSALDHPIVAMEIEEMFELGRRLDLRILHPFWDGDVVDLLYRIPPKLLNGNGRSKRLVREMLARRFPDLGFAQQRKVVANDYVRHFLTREGPSAWRGVGGPRAMVDLDIVDEKALNFELTVTLAGKRPQKIYRIWDILNLETWLRPRL